MFIYNNRTTTVVYGVFHFFSPSYKVSSRLSPVITKQQKENERRHRNDRVVNKLTPTIAEADGGYKRIGPISFAIGSISGTFVVCSPGGVEALS